MGKSKLVGFNATAMKAQMFAVVVAEQNQRLIDYAKEKIIDIGDRINEYHSRNNMDRTGNLLNSLCWGVSYGGKLVDYGFYRDPILRSIGIARDSTSYLHEWFSGNEKYLYPIDGRQRAEEWLNRYGNNGAQGWRVFFAILAPYWGYWEKGFKIQKRSNKTGVPPTIHLMRFAVMTEFYDQFKKDLKGARKRKRIWVEKYDHQKLIDKWNKKAGF